MLTKQQLNSMGFAGLKSARPAKIVPQGHTDRKHEEADLHLSFCSWLKKYHPTVKFVRHEKERRRTHFTGNLMVKYNSLAGLPDFEALERVNVHSEIEGDNGFTYWQWDYYAGFYIEFKKPGEQWTDKHGYIKKQYQHQYECHLHLWSIGRVAYFCNDLEEAKRLFLAYMNGTPSPQQIYPIHEEIVVTL